MKVSENPAGLGHSRTAWFVMPDANGLVKNSAVRMAGIPVGVIKDIKLEGGLAHIELSLRDDIPLTTSAQVEIRANGILGDKHVELIGGNPSDPPLRNGGQIVAVEDRGSLDALMGEVGKITKSLGGVADSLKAATTGEGDTTQPLGRIVHNIEKLTGDLADLTAAKKDKVGEIVDQIHDITATLDEYVSDDSPEGLKAAIKNATASLSRIDRTLRNVEEITDKINKGEGTIGRLVNDETTVDEINKAVEGVNQYLDAGNKLETSVDFHSYYMTNPGLEKSFISLKLQPGPDRYYEIGIVDNPMGAVEKENLVTSGTGGTTNITSTYTYYNKVQFNAEFAKNFYDLTVRGGIIENSGGVGADYTFLRKRLKFSLEAFNFSSLDLRATAQYNFFKGFYLMGGSDDILSKTGGYTSFIGAGLFITNDDLKLLVSKVPL
jgi:phospholipid/cholesterol/gamma-HCH transport system substrate-binding protein